jgi:hypothetical protein
MAAGSAALKRNIKNTSTTTIAMTGTVAKTRFEM